VDPNKIPSPFWNFKEQEEERLLGRMVNGASITEADDDDTNELYRKRFSFFLLPFFWTSLAWATNSIEDPLYTAASEGRCSSGDSIEQSQTQCQLGRRAPTDPSLRCLHEWPS